MHARLCAPIQAALAAAARRPSRNAPNPTHPALADPRHDPQQALTPPHPHTKTPSHHRDTIRPLQRTLRRTEPSAVMLAAQHLIPKHLLIHRIPHSAATLAHRTTTIAATPSPSPHTAPNTNPNSSPTPSPTITAPSNPTRPNIPHRNLLPLQHHHPVHRPSIMRSPSPTPAQRLNLKHLNPIRQLNQPLRTRKQPSTKIRSDPKREHIQPQLIHHRRQLLRLLSSQKLRLIADHIVNQRIIRQRLLDVPEQIRLLIRLDRRRSQAKPAGQHPAASPVIAGEHQAAAAAGRAVVIHLERQGGFPTVHRPGKEHHFGHTGLATPRTGAPPAMRRSSLRSSTSAGYSAWT